MKRYTLFITSALVIISLFSASFLWFVSASHATQRSSPPQQRQVAAFPTRSQWAAKHAQSSTNSNVYGSGDLQYHGGNAETTPQLYIVFWGSGWSSTSPDVQIVKNYFNDVGGTSFENILTQYYGYYGFAIANTLNFSGTWMDTTTPPADHSCGGATIQDTSIQNEVSKAISTNGWPKSAMYFVYTPNGYYINDGYNDCSDQNTLTSFCAYHSYISSQAIPYAAIPYPFDLQGCGVSTSPNGDVYGDSLVNVSSYEQFESISDPDLATGWYDSIGFEISDKCAWDFSAGPTQLNSGTFEVQTEYSNVSSSCVNTYTPGAFIRSDVPDVYAVTTPGQTGWSQPITITNSGRVSLNWSANSLPSWVTITPNSGTIGPVSSQQIMLTINAPNGTTQTYTTNLTLTGANTINSPFSIPITLVEANVSRQWYFGEGYTGGSFTTWLTLANTNQQYANVQVKYLLGSGAPIIKTYLVNPGARYTINVNQEIGPNQNVSMVVTADQPIVAERPMYFNYYGIPGGSDTLGATKLSQDFDFGYLDTSAGHDTWLTILNQNPASMTVSVQYFPASGGSPLTFQHTVGGSSRGTIHVNNEGLPAGSYSALVHLSLPGLVERPMYLIDGQTHYTGAADVVGVTTPQTDWYFAEGYTSSTFYERYILSNPNTSGTANVTVTFFRSTGAPVIRTIQLQPGQQQIVDANSVLGSNNVNNSAHVNANIPILAERFMSFDYSGYVGGGQITSIPGASDVLGAAAPSNIFYFAEGYTGGQFGEYLTIENPDPSQTADVIVNYLSSSGGSPKTQTYIVPPSSRYTVFTNGVMLTQSFSMVVESNVPIMAERPMYFNYYGITGGSDVVGYQPPSAALPPSGMSAYVGTSGNSCDLYSLDATSGAIRWSTQLTGPNNNALSSVVVANGVAYTSLDVTTVNPSDAVYAVNTSDGSLLWSTSISYPSAPAVSGNVVYVTSASYPGVSYSMYALNAQTGAVIWQQQLNVNVHYASAPVVANGVIYYSSNNHIFYALNASDGSPLWSYQTTGYNFTMPVVTNGVVYFGSDDGNMYALNANTGALIWHYQTSRQIYTTPAIANGAIYFISQDGYLYALNVSDGSLIWRVSDSASAVIVDNGMVFTTSNNGVGNGTLLALKASDGSLLWSYPLTYASSPVATNGVVYFTNNASYYGAILYALQETDGSLLWGVNLPGGGVPTIAP